MNAPPPRQRARPAGRPPQRNRRAFWLKHLSRWHWISSAVSLAGLLLFAVTGITLNHAGEIEAEPHLATREAVLPPELRAALAAARPNAETATAPLPPAVADWIARRMDLRPGPRAAEWSSSDVYLALPRPGGDGWLSVGFADGKVTAEITDRGWIAYLNDLHKGRNAGAAWFWFIDLFAAACCLFAATGLLLLVLHASYRKSTWPVVGLGMAVPVLLMILFVH